MDTINCSFCKQTTNDSIELPCGKTMCRIHLEHFKSKYQNQIICFFCHKKHSTKKFYQPIKEDVNSKLKLNDLMIQKLYEKLKELNRINNNPSLFINEYFAQLNNQCDIKREQLKMGIDNHFDKINDQFHKLKQECESTSNSSEIISENFVKLNEKMSKWKNGYIVDKLEYELIEMRLDKDLIDLKHNLLLNKTYKLEGTSGLISVDDICSVKVEDMHILSHNEEILIKNENSLSKTFVIDQFTDFKDKYKKSYSPKYTVGSLSWTLVAKARFIKNIGLCLNIYLKICSESDLIKWSVNGELKLLHVNDSSKNYIKSLKLVNNEDCCTGFSSSIRMKKIMDNGYYNAEKNLIKIKVSLNIIEKTININES